MVFLGALAALVIIIIICMLGPLEIFLLNAIGFSFAESFNAQIKIGSIAGSVKGGALVLILGVQPIVLGALFLRMLNAIFQASIVKKARVRKALDVEKSGVKPKSSGDLNSLLRTTNEAPTPNFSVGSVAFANMTDMKIREQRNPFQLIASVITFRGSTWHFRFILVSAVIHVWGLLAAPIGWAIVASSAPLLVCLYGPTLFAYLLVFGVYQELRDPNAALIRRARSKFYPNYLIAEREQLIVEDSEKRVAEEQDFLTEFRKQIFFLDRKEAQRIWNSYREIKVRDRETFQLLQSRIYERSFPDLDTKSSSESLPISCAYFLLVLFREARFALVLRYMRAQKFNKKIVRFVETDIHSRLLLLKSTDRHDLRDAVLEERSRMENVNLPILFRQLIVLGEMRGEMYSFRWHPNAYHLLEKGWLRYLFRLLPII
jgi:hypothetical protein